MGSQQTDTEPAVATAEPAPLPGLGDHDLSRVAGGRQQAGGAVRGSVLLVGFDAAVTAPLLARLSSAAEVLLADGPEDGLATLFARPVSVLCLGEALAGHRARRFLDLAEGLGPKSPGAGDSPPVTPRRDVVLAAGNDLAVFQDLVDEDRLFYLTPRPPSAVDIEPIVRSALEPRNRRAPGHEADADGEGWTLAVRSVLELAQGLAAESRPASVARKVAEEAARLVEADDAECLVVDAGNDILWRSRGDGDESFETGPEPESTVAGLVGFVARTGRLVCLDRVGSDPRYDPSADNPRGGPEDRLLIVPVVANAEVLAIVTVRRAAESPELGDGARRRLELLARHLGPTFSRLALAADWAVESQPATMSTLYRQEALSYRLRGAGDAGRPLEISPTWASWVLYLLLALAAFAVAFSFFGSMHEYAAGPAVVVLGERVDITATAAGTVESPVVEAGTTVAKGDLLVRLHSAQEVAELERIRREFELALVQRLRDPGDSVIERGLSSLRAQKELAEARLEERSLRAPRAGVVSDLRVQPGQYLSPGQVVLTLIREGQEPGIVALLPGRFLPLLEVGMEVRFELEGYSGEPHFLLLDSLGDEALGPVEARRVLGAEMGETVPLSGPVVWVKAPLPAAAFESSGRTVRFHDGTPGKVEIKVRSESIVSALVPGLKAVFGETS